MKTFIGILCVLALAGASRAVELKIATVDMDRLVKEYYRAEQVAKDLQASHAALFTELAGMRVEYDRLVTETHDLEERSSDPALNTAAREERRKQFELKLSDLRAFKVHVEEVTQQREAEWQSQRARAEERILDEILVATRGIGDKEGFNLVLHANKSKPLSGGVLFVKNVDDLTDKVLARLNATRPSPKEEGSKQEPKKQD
jgi:Skp family chaperone for outer membrane proteins